jgi:uncharacterized protein (UPF0332 family)
MADLPAEAGRELEQARDALADARVLQDGEGTDSGVISRLYYATFHAAQAALYARGHNPTSHGQVRQQFGQQLVLDGPASRDDGRLLGTLYDYRREADYGAGNPNADIGDLLTAVEAFLDQMSELVDESTD